MWDFPRNGVEVFWGYLEQLVGLFCQMIGSATVLQFWFYYFSHPCHFHQWVLELILEEESVWVLTVRISEMFNLRVAVGCVRPSCETIRMAFF